MCQRKRIEVSFPVLGSSLPCEMLAREGNVNVIDRVGVKIEIGVLPCSLNAPIFPSCRD